VITLRLRPCFLRIRLVAGDLHAELARFVVGVRDGEREVLWLGPDEWLVVAPPGRAIRLLAELEFTLDGVPHSVVDVSANRVIIDVAGTKLLELLSKGCSLDLHPSRWPNGACAQTTLARAQVILHRRDAAMRIFVRPSFADYLVDWLVDAAGS